ncbi:hypothetical protein V1525DRAFT_354483 [Lipomyces kononenkoae]|uniref:Uncharacterized protein n=1 Tax=Lipomyces kononenkoae TaxID=34357 RepID=A0ACC3T9R4_LIPKO
MNFSTRQQQQQLPKQTYGRRTHRSRHWQGLTDTDLWTRTSPVKRVSSILPMFSPKSQHSTEDATVPNGGRRFSTASDGTTQSRATVAESPVKYKEELSENTVFQEDKENNDIKISRRSSLSKMKSALAAATVQLSPRRPLVGKSVNLNHATPNVNASRPPESYSIRSEPLVLELPETISDLSDLSACLDVISSTDFAKPVASLQSSSPAQVARDEELDRSPVSSPPGPLPSSTPISLDTPEDNVQDNASWRTISAIAIPKRQSSLAHLDSNLSSPVAIERARSSNSPSPKKDVNKLPRKLPTPLSSPNSVSPIHKGALLPSSPLRNVTNVSDLDAVVEVPISDLDDLLNCCTDREVQNFSEFIASFKDSWNLHKLGEASYSEVFSAVHNKSGASHVLKIMPFGEPDAEIEQATVDDITNELKISKTLMEYDGFVKVISAHVVKGTYSDILLLLWDEFDAAKGSENVRPDFYEDDQHYCIIILNNAGTDLEHFQVKSWIEAAAIFWTVARSIANAEKFVNFEHRDLHWGNIVLHRPETVTDMMANLSLGDQGSDVNVKATIIDYTLSRAKCNNELVYTNMDDPAIYTGKGDYQFDIYRFIRKLFSASDDAVCNEPAAEALDHTKARRRSIKSAPHETAKYNWAEYCPKTNVLWLHYLAERLMNHKQLIAPRLGRQSGRNVSPRESVSQSDIDAYQSLEAVFKLIDPRKKRYTGKKGRPPHDILCAQDLITWSHDEGYYV